MSLPPHLLDVTMLWGPTSGGMRRYLTAKRAWLRQQGQWRHTLVAPILAGDGCVPLEGVPLPFFGGCRVPLNRRELAQELVARKPDLIEVGDPYQPAWAARDAARQLDIPLVGFCHASPEAWLRRIAGAPAGWAARRYLRHLYAGFDQVLAPSRHLRDHLRDCGVDQAQYQSLGVDTDLFTPASQDRSWRAGLGLSPQARILVYAGRFGADKHLSVLAHAVRRLGPPYVLVAIGEGPWAPQGDQVIVLPFMHNTPALARALASADVFVHAGENEPCGLALLEAMACGCPVVAHASGAPAELVDTHVGELVHRRHPDAYAQAIEAVFEGGLANRAQAARTKAMAHRWPAILPGLMSRYQHLMEAARHDLAIDWMSPAVSP